MRNGIKLHLSLTLSLSSPLTPFFSGIALRGYRQGLTADADWRFFLATSVELLDEDFRVGRTVITPLSPEPLRVPLCVLDLGSLQDRIRVPSDILPIVVVGARVVGARECLVFELVFEVDHYAAYQGEDFLVGCAS